MLMHRVTRPQNYRHRRGPGRSQKAQGSGRVDSIYTKTENLNPETQDQTAVPRQGIHTDRSQTPIRSLNMRRLKTSGTNQSVY
jgi:hypothetical protein